MYRYILLKPLGIRFSESNSRILVREQALNFVSGIQVCLGGICVESVLDRHYLESEQTVGSCMTLMEISCRLVDLMYFVL